MEDLLLRNGLWNASLIWSLFEEKSAMNILATHPAPELGEDEVVWGETADNGYTTKSGYQLLQGARREGVVSQHERSDRNF